jgi:hypothetical protein
MVTVEPVVAVPEMVGVLSFVVIVDPTIVLLATEVITGAGVLEFVQVLLTQL